MPRPTHDPGWPPGESETARLMRGHDWAATPLGATEGWSERLRLVVEMMLDSQLVCTVVCGPERLLVYNDAAARLYGDRSPGAFGRPLAEAFPESYPAVAGLYDRAFAGETVLVEAQPVDVSDRGGEVFESHLTPVRDGDGRVVAVHMVGFEVGGRLKAEAAVRASQERQAFLLRLSDAVRALDDPAAVLGESTRLLREHLGAGWCGYVEWDETGTLGSVQRDSVGEGLPSAAGLHDLSDLPELAGALRSGGLLRVPDLSDTPRLDPGFAERAAAFGLHAILAAPLVEGGRLVASLVLGEARPRDWTSGDSALVEEVAQRIRTATERARAAAAMRTSEERFGAIVETARDYAIFTTDPEGRIETWPKGAAGILGWTAEEAQGQSVDMTFTPEDRVRGAPRRERQEAREKGQAANVRWHLRKDGTRVFIEGSVRPLTGPDGSVTGFVKVGQDVTERRAIEDALRESEERFRQFGDAAGDVLWVRDARTLAFEYVSPAFEEIFGSPLEQLLGRNQVRRWAEMILPEDREAAIDALRKARDGEHILQTVRIRRSDGEIRWIRDTSFPLLDEAGRVRRLAGIYHDATAEVALQDRLRVLVAELQHRTRNLIGVVRGVAERTRATSASLEEFGPRFLARLDALGRASVLLAHLREGERITLDQLLRTELAAHGVADGDGRVVLDGPKDLRLRSAPVQTLALVLHELAANAREHGALSRPEGRTEVTWGIEAGEGRERWLRLDWQESWSRPDGASEDEPATPIHQGHGRQLIERALPYQLGARTRYELGPEGLRCFILAPVQTTLDEPIPGGDGT